MRVELAGATRVFAGFKTRTRHPFGNGLDVERELLGDLLLGELVLMVQEVDFGEELEVDHLAPPLSICSSVRAMRRLSSRPEPGLTAAATAGAAGTVGPACVRGMALLGSTRCLRSSTWYSGASQAINAPAVRPARGSVPANRPPGARKSSAPSNSSGPIRRRR